MQVEYHGKLFPTYFKFKGKDYGQTVEKECHINQRSRMTFETDVVNDYFSRKIDAGMFELFRVNGSARQPATAFVGPNLSNGIATLSVRLPDNCREGYSHLCGRRNRSNSRRTIREHVHHQGHRAP